jgi:hypothetical protein
MIPEHRRAAGVGRLGGVPGFLTERVSYTLAAMSLYVLLLKPAEPTVFDDAPSKPFHCTVIAHYPVTGPYAHVLVASLSSEDKRANEESFKSPLPRTVSSRWTASGTSSRSFAFMLMTSTLPGLECRSPISASVEENRPSHLAT